MNVDPRSARHILAAIELIKAELENNQKENTQ